MTSTTIYLYRHGNTFGPDDKVVQVGLQSDLPLTSQGESQAKQFADWLIREDITPQGIYHGQLLRQKQSAFILQSRLPCSTPLQQTKALDEIDYGKWEGLSAEAINQQWPTESCAWQKQAQWPTAFFNGSVEAHTQKLAALLNQIYSTVDTNHNPIILVSSNGILRLLLQFTSHWDKLVQHAELENYKIKTGHYCQVTLTTPDTLEIVSWNQKPVGIN